MLKKATLVRLKPGGVIDKETEIEVQFNPQQLSISYSFTGQDGTFKSGKGTSEGSAAAQTNHRTDYRIRLSALDLYFDTTQTGMDVRNLTQRVARLLLMDGQEQKKYSPIIQFQWGKLLFIGTISSMDETIDYFSEEGVPLRATVKLTLAMTGEREATPSSGSGIGLGVSVSANAGVSAGVSASVGFAASANLSAGGAVGTSSLTLASAGASLQGIAGKAGVDWKVAAAANNIDNPRLLEAGAVLNMDAGVGVSASFQL